MSRSTLATADDFPLQMVLERFDAVRPAVLLIFSPPIAEPAPYYTALCTMNQFRCVGQRLRSLHLTVDHPSSPYTELSASSTV